MPNYFRPAQKIVEIIPWHARQIGPDLGNRLPEQVLNLLPRHPATSTLGTPASSRRTTLASGRASPVHHSWRMVKPSNRSPSSVLPQLRRDVAHRDARPPLRTPVGAVVGARRGAGLPFLHLNRLGRGQYRCSPREPVGLIAVKVDPLDAIGVATARRHHIHRRHRCLRLGCCGSVSQHPMAMPDKPCGRACGRRPKKV